MLAKTRAGINVLIRMTLLSSLPLSFSFGPSQDILIIISIHDSVAFICRRNINQLSRDSREAKGRKEYAILSVLTFELSLSGRWSFRPNEYTRILVPGRHGHDRPCTSVSPSKFRGRDDIRWVRRRPGKVVKLDFTIRHKLASRVFSLSLSECLLSFPYKRPSREQTRATSEAADTYK